jgi:hypothetical protein
MQRASRYAWYPCLIGNALILMTLLRLADSSFVIAIALPVVVTGGALFCLEWAHSTWRPPHRPPPVRFQAPMTSTGASPCATGPRCTPIAEHGTCNHGSQEHRDGATRLITPSQD